MRVADYVVESLVRENVNHIFMVTGRGILFLTDAVAKNSNVDGISVHHEQSGAYAAYAYAQRKKNVGVCMVSTGVGATNAITGVLNAWQDDIPVVFVSGQHMLNETTYHTGVKVRTYGQQEANIVEIVRSITKYAVMIEKAEDAAYEIEKAIHLAKTGRKGPVWIDIPLDIQNARIDAEFIRHYDTLGLKDVVPPAERDIREVAKDLNDAERPIILIGSGVRSASAELDIRKLSIDYRIPVVFDSAAVDIYPDIHELSIGTIGSLGGSRVGNFALQNSDYVLVIGCRLTSMQVGEEPEKFARSAKIVVVDIDEEETKKKTVNMNSFIRADAKCFLEMLLSSDCMTHKNRENWIDKCLHWKAIFPKCEEWCKEGEVTDLYYLAEVIGDEIEEDTTITCDAGIEELVVPPVVCKNEKIKCVHPASQGCMGFALGASIGCYYASGDEVVAVIGDGSIMMNLQELQTIFYRKLPIKIFIANNNCYSVIRTRQMNLFRTRTIGTDSDNGISCADFKKIADAFGLSYRMIKKHKEATKIVKEVLQMEGPVICEVITPENQQFLRNAVGRSENRKFVRRYLEDQAPFLDRNLIRREMIIPMIEE